MAYIRVNGECKIHNGISYNVYRTVEYQITYTEAITLHNLIHLVKYTIIIYTYKTMAIVIRTLYSCI